MKTAPAAGKGVRNLVMQLLEQNSTTQGNVPFAHQTVVIPGPWHS